MAVGIARGLQAVVQFKARQAELDAKNDEMTEHFSDKQNLDEELSGRRAQASEA